MGKTLRGDDRKKHRILRYQRKTKRKILDAPKNKGRQIQEREYNEGVPSEHFRYDGRLHHLVCKECG